MIEAGFWGLVSGSALVLGALIAYFFALPQRLIAGIMALGAGVLISAVAFDLVDEALQLDPLPKVIWMQLTVRNDAAALRAEAKGVQVVMNRCPKMEYGKHSGEWGWVGGASGILSSQRMRLHESGKIQSLGLRPRVKR